MKLRERWEPTVLTLSHWIGLAAVCGWLMSLSTTNWWEVLVVLIVDVLVGMWGISATFHRLLSHRAYQAPIWWHRLGSILGCLALQGSTIAWVGVHRQHHRKSDITGDPHSPILKGKAWVFFRNGEAKPNLQTVRDLLRDPFHTTLHKYYWWLTLGYISVITVLLGPRALLYAWIVPITKAFYSSTFVNAFCHAPKLRNLAWAGTITGGEAWHLNHHETPTNPQHNKGNRIFDPGSWPAYILGNHERVSNAKIPMQSSVGFGLDKR